MRWWLSFADRDRAPGDTFVGISIVEADSMIEACKRAWRLGCNPGGEALGSAIGHNVAPGVVDRALTVDEIVEWGAPVPPEVLARLRAQAEAS